MLDHDLVERLAQVIHDRYRTHHAQTAAAAVALPWTGLSDDVREANRAQARDIEGKLAAIGCVIGVGPGPEFSFAADEIETLAIAEHERWTRQRASSGWFYGVALDHDKKTHPSMVAWERLSEQERDKDRDAVRQIPAVLATAGLHLARRVPKLPA